MYKNIFKRVFDLLLSIAVLPFWLIILIIVGPLIYFEDRGSIFYNSSRIGKDGKIFRMYKFRSMKMNAPDIRNNDGSTFNAEDDPRLTKIGKFIRKTSLDETPQIINVIKGDMSLIGPRPDLPSAMNKYDSFQIKRLLVRPGITGYSQAFFRNSIDMKDKYKNDIFYINNLSLILDAKILIKTITSIFSKKNIFNKDGSGDNYSNKKVD